MLKDGGKIIHYEAERPPKIVRIINILRKCIELILTF